ncbi:MAG: hypothetical protein II416_05790 [Prevotella sp.]|nr:hypothetical protein [Prevotella sp.]
MKRNYFIISLIAFLSLSFFSCSNDDDDDKDSFIGVWVSEGTLPMYEYGVTTSEVVGHVKVYFRFMEDGSLKEEDVITYIESGKSYTETSTYGRWSATKGHLKIIVSFADVNPKENADEIECTYQFTNGKLVLSYKDEETGQLITVSFVRGQMP